MSRVDFVFDEQFERGKQYVIYVTQVNSYGLESEFSDPAFITAGSEDIPPPKLTADDGSFDSNDSIKVRISWQDSTNEDLDFYQLYLYKGVPDWFTSGGYYTDDFPSNSKKFSASKDQLDLTFQNLEHDQTYTAGIETIDVYGNVSGTRYVLSFIAVDHSNVQRPVHEIHGASQGYWCLHVWTNKPSDPAAKYIQFFRDGVTALNPVDCRSSNIVEILDSFGHDEGLTHRYSYRIVRFDGRESEMSYLSDPFTANAIDESALDPDIKEKWKEEFLEDIEDRVDTLELEHVDHDRKIRNLQDNLNKLGEESQSRDDQLQNEINSLKNDSKNIKDKLDHCCNEVNQKLNSLQSQINGIKNLLDRKADKSYVDNKIAKLDQNLRQLINNESNTIQNNLQNFVYAVLNSYATKQYVDSKISTLDSSLRQVITNSIESSKQSVLREVQNRLNNLVQSTIPNLIQSSNNALEQKLKKYSDDQDSALYNRIINLLDQLKEKLNTKFAVIDQKINACKTYTDSQINNLKTNIDNKFKNYLTTAQITQYVQNQLTNLRVEFGNYVRSSIQTAKTDIETAYKRYTDNAVNDLKSTLLPRIQSVEEQIRYLNTQNSTIDSRISTKVISKLTEFGIEQSTISDLKSRMTSAESAITSILNPSGRLSTLETRVNTLVNSLTTNINSKISTWWQNLVNAGLNLKNVTIENLIITKSLTIRDGATVNGLELSSSSGGTPIPAPEPDDIFERNSNWTANPTLKNGSRIAQFPLQFTPDNTNQVGGNITASIHFTGIIAIAIVNSINPLQAEDYPTNNSWTAKIGKSSSDAGTKLSLTWYNTYAITNFGVAGAVLNITTPAGSIDVRKLRDLGINQNSDRVFVATVEGTWTGSLTNNTANFLYLTLSTGNSTQSEIVKAVFNAKDTLAVTYS